MNIKTVTVIGRGALGVLFAGRMAETVAPGDLRLIADRDRVARYRREKLTCNGEACSFRYITPQDGCPPCDLLIFAVKFNGLGAAIDTARQQVGQQTIVISLLNGISSEEILSEAFGRDKVVCCVAQGMDAVMEGSSMRYEHRGMLCIGDTGRFAGMDKVRTVADFFERTGVPYSVEADMNRKMWGKFMVNVGVNQTVAVFGPDYGSVQAEGEQREVMIAAMKEVIAVSAPEGVSLTEADLAYWLGIIGTLSPAGKPSMRQDVEARRPSEVELFSGTVLALGRKHGIATPVNAMLYTKIREAESGYHAR